MTEWLGGRLRHGQSVKPVRSVAQKTKVVNIDRSI